MSRPPGLPKSGGRSAGEPNRANRELKQYLQGVFREALFNDQTARAKLVADLRAFTLEPRLLQLLMAYAFGAPSREVDVHHAGQVTLAQLVSGSALAGAGGYDGSEDDLDDEPDDEPPTPAQDGSPQS